MKQVPPSMSKVYKQRAKLTTAILLLLPISFFTALAFGTISIPLTDTANALFSNIDQNSSFNKSAYRAPY